MKLFMWCAALLTLAAAHCGAQTYPARPIRMIVPYPSGGGVDAMARLITPKLSEQLGQQVIADNRAGATGNIGAEIAAHAPPDGYTLLMAGGSLTINVSLYGKLAYDLMKDFVPVSAAAQSPNIVLVHPSLPVRSIKELIALARARPGQLNYASGGSGSTLHLTAELFKTMAGVNMVHVPYKGTGPAIVALISGEVSLSMPPLAGMVSYVNTGRVRALGVTSKKRLALLPQIPTVSEAGLPGFESSQWYGILLPAGTSPDIVARLQSAVARVVRLPDVAEQIARQGAIPVGDTPEQFAAFLREDIARWAKVVKASGARVE